MPKKLLPSLTVSPRNEEFIKYNIVICSGWYIDALVTRAAMMWPDKSSEQQARALTAIKESHACNPPTARVPLWVLAFDKPPVPHTWPAEDLVPAGVAK